MWLAFPVMLSQVGQIALNVADTVMVGKVDDPHQSEINLGAVSLGNSVFILLLVSALGISIIMSPLAAEKDVDQNYKAGADIFSHGLVINILFSIILGIITVFFSDFMYYLGQPEEVVKEAIPYLNISAFSLIPIMVFQTFRQFGEGLSLTLPATIATWIAIILNIFLNYCFIEGNFGFPAMGVQGAALGSLIARFFSTICIFVIVLQWKKFKTYLQHVSFKRWSYPLFKKMIQLGIPTSFQMFFEVSAFTAAAFIAGLASKTDLAAHQVAIQLASISFLLCTGLAVAATVRIGNQKGIRDFKMLREVGYSNIKMTGIFMFFCGILFILFREQLPWGFTQSENAAALASNLLIIAALFQLGDGVQLVTLGALRGIQDVNIPMIITFVAYWIITIPLSYICAIHFEMGAFGVWIGLGTGLTISALALLYRYNKLTQDLIEKN
ncbi:putative multidrug resistance protein NorM [Flavobacteriaceae bacterium UJ101]|nr:putative multidrug resistance protein NorM [Flavobacteriaceae bacterium UJ101]